MVSESTNEERFEFIRRVFDLVPEEEIHGIKNLISKAAKRRKRKSAAQNNVSSNKLTRKSDVEPLELVPVPDNSVSVPIGSKLSNCWYELYKDMVAIDIEKVIIN